MEHTLSAKVLSQRFSALTAHSNHLRELLMNNTYAGDPTLDPVKTESGSPQKVSMSVHGSIIQSS